MKKTLLCVALLLVASSLLHAKTWKLKYVIDGDTAVFNQGTCRFAYIDTPESKRNAKATRDVADCPGVTLDDIIVGGRYAKRYLKSAMKKGEEYHIEVKGQDRYHRYICVIYDRDNVSFNDKLVRDGFAVPFWRYIHNTSVKEKMISFVKNAKSTPKGIWRTNPNVMECMN